MTEIRKLEPHDPVPEGPGKILTVLRRLQEDVPGGTVVEIILSGIPGGTETSRPIRGDGTPMSLREAIEAAREVARSEDMTLVHVIDRAAGPRERDILRHRGDHSIHMDRLEDFDLEDGERGTDMRDRR